MFRGSVRCFSCCALVSHQRCARTPSADLFLRRAKASVQLNDHHAVLDDTRNVLKVWCCPPLAHAHEARASCRLFQHLVVSFAHTPPLCSPLQVDENNLEALLLRGRAFFALGEPNDIDTALSHFRHGLKLDPEHKARHTCPSSASCCGWPACCGV